MNARLSRISGRTVVIAVPFLFLLVFFLFPFVIVGKISVSEMETVSFKDVLSWSDGVLTLAFFGVFYNEFINLFYEWSTGEVGHVQLGV